MKIKSIVLTVALLASVFLFSTGALATNEHNFSGSQETGFTLTNSGLEAGDQYVVLMVMGETLDVDSIIYIDQSGVDSDGNLDFGTFYPKASQEGSASVWLATNSTTDTNFGSDGNAIRLDNVNIISDGLSVTGTLDMYKYGSYTTAPEVVLTNESGTYSAIVDMDTLTYKIEGVPAGTYTLKATKPGYTSYTKENVEISEEGQSLGEAVLYAGDVNNNGSININDIDRLVTVFGKNTADVGEDYKYADVNENGSININDIDVLVTNFAKNNIIE